MRKVILCTLVLVMGVACDNGSFSEDNETNKVVATGTKSDLTFSVETTGNKSSGEIVKVGSTISNEIPITLSESDQQDKILRVTIENREYGYFKDLKKITLVDDSIRDTNASISFSMDDDSDVISFSIINFAELIRLGKINLNLKFKTKDIPLHLFFRDSPTYEKLKTIDAGELGPVANQYSKVTVLGEEYQALTFYKVMNESAQEQRLDLQTANEKNTLKRVGLVKDIVVGDCSSDIKESNHLQEFSYLILPLNKNTGEAIASIRNAEKNSNLMIELKAEETLELGMFVKSIDYPKVIGKAKALKTIGVQAAVSCSHFCKWPRYRSCYQGDRYRTRNPELITGGLVRSDLEIDLEKRILAGYSVENSGTKPTTIHAQKQISSTTYSEHEGLVKLTNVTRLIKEKDGKNCIKKGCGSGGGPRDVPN